MALTLMKGSEAIAEAAIRAGCRYFFGYPITPQTEIPEYMSVRMPQIGGCFLQAESEVGAINMVYGAAGTGYRVLAKGSDLEFALGYSHSVTVKAPEGITFTVETPTRFTVTGIDKQQVGEVAANIRKLRKPDPYKGKGVRYEGERIRRKVGKAGK